MTFGKIKLTEKNKLASIKKFYIGLIFLAILAIISILATGVSADSCQDELVKDYAKLQNDASININDEGYLIFKGPIDDVMKINLQKQEGGSQIIYCFDYEDDCPVGCQDVDDVCILDRNGNILYKDNFFWGHADEIPETRVDVKAGDQLIVEESWWGYLGLEIWKENVCEPEPVCEDNDEDGFSVTGEECGAVDCNDENAGIYPGAAELCDWVDNNCDGTTDNNENCVVACSANTDCGINNWINGLFCQAEDVYQNFKSFFCNLAGTYDSYCSNNVVVQSKIDCGEDSCGTFGNNYCENGDVYHSRTCHDKGCANGGCFDNQNIDEQLVQDCSYGCLLGTCLFEPPVINCYDNEDCDDQDAGTEDICVNPGQENSYCTNEPYEDILCSTNSECGTNGYINQLVCSNGNVVQDYRTFTCNNAGTTSSYCSNSISQQLKQTCQYGCEAGACLPQLVQCTTNTDCSADNYSDDYCSNGNVYRDLHDYSCVFSECVFDTIPQLQETCQYGCTSGQCSQAPVQCTTDSDCNSLDDYSDEYCSNGDVYKDFNDYSCEQGNCVKDTAKNLVEECDSDETCSAGECEEEDDEDKEDEKDKKQIFADDLLSDELLPLTLVVKGKIIDQGGIYLVPEEKQVKGSNLWLILIAILVVLMVLFFILIVFYSRKR